MNYIRKNNKVEYIGIEPTDTHQLNSVLSSLFLELGFIHEFENTELNIFSKCKGNSKRFNYNKDLMVSLSFSDNTLGISIPTKNQILSMLEFNNLSVFHINLIELKTDTKTSFELHKTENLSVCNIVLAFIRFLWHTKYKAHDDYLKDIAMFVENTNKGLI